MAQSKEALCLSGHRKCLAAGDGCAFLELRAETPGVNNNIRCHIQDIIYFFGYCSTLLCMNNVMYLLQQQKTTSITKHYKLSVFLSALAAETCSAFAGGAPRAAVEGDIVMLHYVCRDEDGNVVDTSRGNEEPVCPPCAL